MGEEHEADCGSVLSRVASGLVVPVDAAEPEAVPGGDLRTVQLEEPEAKPAALECQRRELAVEGLAAREL